MTTEHDVSTEKQPPVSPPTPEKSKLPFTIGQLGMWIFISTEVMLFAGIIAVYLVLRLTTLQSGWPTRTDMHVYTETGITMTIFLVFSAVCAWQSWIACNESRPRAARLWLVVTILLGCIFLGIKFNEYYDKYKVGLMPIPGENQIHETADHQYLSHVNQRLRSMIIDFESLDPQTLDENDKQKMELLYSLKAHMTEATARNAGRTNSPFDARLYMNLMAYQVYPHVDTGKDIDRVYLPERKVLNRELDVLNERLGLVRKREPLIVQQLSNLEGQIERFDLLSGSTEETDKMEAKKQWLETKKQQQQDLAVESRQLQASISPLQGREDILSASFDTEGSFEGLNERYDLRLPVVIPNGQAWMSVYLLLTGMHALHLIVGLIALACWLPQKLTARKSPAFYVTCMYWQFVDAMWLTIFWFIYL